VTFVSEEAAGGDKGVPIIFVPALFQPIKLPANIWCVPANLSEVIHLLMHCVDLKKLKTSVRISLNMCFLLYEALNIRISTCLILLVTIRLSNVYICMYVLCNWGMR
jgi:hypothetical protein